MTSLSPPRNGLPQLLVSVGATLSTLTLPLLTPCFVYMWYLAIVYFRRNLTNEKLNLVFVPINQN